MKKTAIAAAVPFLSAACSTSLPSDPTLSTSTRVYGPTVENPRPLTPAERFILDYRTMKPGDTRTDPEVAALVPLVCDSQSFAATLTALAENGYTPEESGWIIARADCGA